MKKIICFLFLCCFFLMGCTNHFAKDAVVEYLEKFRNHDVDVEASLLELLKYENLLQEEQDVYSFVLKRQFQDLEYKVLEERYDGDSASVFVEITVYDYYKSRKDALDYNEKHLGELNEFELKDLQLSYMTKETKRIKYTIEFHVNYDGDKWILETPDYTVVQKINGIYDYES